MKNMSQSPSGWGWSPNGTLSPEHYPALPVPTLGEVPRALQGHTRPCPQWPGQMWVGLQCLRN